MNINSNSKSKYYDLVFKERNWIRRLTEKLHIEDPQDTKKSCTFDVSIPFILLRWNQVEDKNPHASSRRILPLMFMKKSTIKDMDVTIGRDSLSVTTKKCNEKIENILKNESKKRLKKEIRSISDSEVRDASKRFRKQIECIFSDVNKDIENKKRIKSFEEIESDFGFKKLKDINKLKEKLKSHYFIYRLFSQYFLFSILLPIELHEKERVIIKVSFEIPDKNFSNNQYHDKLKDVFKAFSLDYVQDELEYELETTSLPYSHHVLIDLPKGIKATDFRYAYRDNFGDKDQPGLLYTRKIKGHRYGFYNINNIKKGKIYVNKDLEPRIIEGELKPSIIKYRAIPEKQGIRRWSFMLSWVVPLLVIFSIFANSHGLAKDSGERSAVVTVLATFSVLFIVWMAKGTEIPIYAKAVLPLRFSILFYLIGTYLTIIVVILGDGSKPFDGVCGSNNGVICFSNNPTNPCVWRLGWMLIYTVFSIATSYSLIVHVYYHNLRSGHMVWSKWWICVRRFCILAFFGSPLIFPIIWFLDTHNILNESIGTFEWVIIGINIIYLFFIAIIFISIPFRPNPRLNNKPTR